MGLAIIAIFMLIFAIVGALMAEHRGRSLIGWGLCCAFFGLLGVIALAIAGVTDGERERRAAVEEAGRLKMRAELRG
jgi:hypothetical protein